MNVILFYLKGQTRIDVAFLLSHQALHTAVQSGQILLAMDCRSKTSLFRVTIKTSNKVFHKIT